MNLEHMGWLREAVERINEVIAGEEKRLEEPMNDTASAPSFEVAAPIDSDLPLIVSLAELIKKCADTVIEVATYNNGDSG
jgi:hypothetical protein